MWKSYGFDEINVGSFNTFDDGDDTNDTMIGVCWERSELELDTHALQNGFEVALMSCFGWNDKIIC